MLLEKKNPYVLTTDGQEVKRGSRAHVRDLERRLSELETWRKRHPKGSENRALYSRLISKLRHELNSSVKSQVNEATDQHTYVETVKELLENTYGDLRDAVKMEPKIAEFIECAKELDVLVRTAKRADADDQWVYHGSTRKKFSHLRSLAVHCLGYEPAFKQPIE